MTTSALRTWRSVHTWTSLVCALFLLLLCITGLPLIFHDEIDHALGAAVSPDAAPPDAPMLSLDRILSIGKNRRPNDVVTFAVPDDDDPVWHLFMARSVTSPRLSAVVAVDGHTGRILHEGESARSPLIRFLKDLHTTLFLDETGMLFLGAIGFCFVLSVFSGVVVYAPFMGKLDFGTVRRTRRRPYWLDVHNLTGIALTAWLLVVGATGVVNTLSQQVARRWQATELAEMIAPWRNAPVPAVLSSAQAAMEQAMATAPGMKVESVAMPGTPFAGGHHYGVFLSGDSPLTSRLIMPVLIDAVDGSLTAKRELPWYAKALFISKSLHFGDYGGMPLKVIWAMLDLITIAVLGSGLYLWWARVRVPRDRNIAPANPGGAAA